MYPLTWAPSYVQITPTSQDFPLFLFSDQITTATHAFTLGHTDMINRAL